jgi:hypothetical protein
MELGPQPPERAGVADSFTYVITVTTDRSHAVTVGAQAMSPELRRLVDFVNDVTRAGGPPIPTG